MTKLQQSEREQACSELRETLKPGTTVYTVLRHVSRSGMSRDIDVYVIEDGEPRRITYTVAKAADLTYSRKAEAIKIGGCGMDMGFAVVYNLSRSLYNNGHSSFACIGKGCPSNDHSNSWYSVREGVCPCCKREGLNKAEHQRADDTDFTKNTGGFTVCRRCAEHNAGWIHSDGGYALKQRWM
jgi:hypothetical protein